MRVTVSENAASGTGDYSGGGGIFNGDRRSTAALVMTDSTVSGNTAAAWTPVRASANARRDERRSPAARSAATTGGGIGNSGHLEPSTVTLTNCTVSGNQAICGAGGISNGSSGATLNLRSSTVTLNRRIARPERQGAGGIVGGSGPTVLRNTIVAGNIDDENPNVSYSPDCDDNGAATVVSEGFSLVGDGTHCTGLVDGVNGDQIGTGVPRSTPSSGRSPTTAARRSRTRCSRAAPRIDGGDPATPGSGGTACPATDQRGETRPNGTACDVGSFEGGGAAARSPSIAVQPASGGNVGTVQARCTARASSPAPRCKLVRAGSADVVGSGSDVGGSTITTSFDLRGAAPGVWSVVVDESRRVDGDARRRVHGRGRAAAPDLWSELVLPRAFTAGRYQSIYVVIRQPRHRRRVRRPAVARDSRTSSSSTFPFRVSAPPAQPGQVAMDWTRIAIDAPIPPPEDRDSFSAPAAGRAGGLDGALKFRVKNPPPPENCQGDECVDPSHLPFNVSADIGPPYFEPNLSRRSIAGYVEQAKEYVAEAHDAGCSVRRRDRGLRPDAARGRRRGRHRGRQRQRLPAGLQPGPADHRHRASSSRPRTRRRLARPGEPVGSRASWTTSSATS